MTTKTIDKFTGDNRFLSNFYPALVSFEDVSYPTVEHAYVAAKTESDVWRGTIASTSSPGAVKRIGRRIPLREGWDTYLKYDVMEFLLSQKFSPDTPLGMKLFETGDVVLIEGNDWHDNIWGVCRCITCPGRGANILGWMLMRQRLNVRDHYWLMAQ